MNMDVYCHNIHTSARKTIKMTRQASVILLCFDISGVSVSQLFIIFIIPEI